MRDRLAIYVCPEKGCAAIGASQARCAAHHVLLVREVYRREGALADAQVAAKLRETADKIGAIRGETPLDKLFKGFGGGS